MQDTPDDTDLSLPVMPNLLMIAPSITFAELADNFDLFDDWEDRYRYIIDLGKKLPPFPDALKIEANKVRGCMSQVWIVPGHVPDDETRFAFAADSDAHIVKGLVYVLASLYTGAPMAEVAGIDIEAAFARLGLDQHLSPSRRNGLVSMVGRIRAAAVARNV
jgi:cysteine desulfuration protein SufE